MSPTVVAGTNLAESLAASPDQLPFGWGNNKQEPRCDLFDHRAVAVCSRRRHQSYCSPLEPCRALPPTMAALLTTPSCKHCFTTGSCPLRPSSKCDQRRPVGARLEPQAGHLEAEEAASASAVSAEEAASASAVSAEEAASASAVSAEARSSWMLEQPDSEAPVSQVPEVTSAAPALSELVELALEPEEVALEPEEVLVQAVPLAPAAR